MKDEAFIRGQVPMTKSEVRAVSISKLGLCDNSIVYDIGAGTGSVAVEMALAMGHGHVYAIEQREEGCRLIGQNQEHFGVRNLTIVPGKAPDVLKDLPAADRVFIGGSGGELPKILDLVREKNPSARMVINAVSLETLSAVTEYLRGKGMEAEIVSIQTARARKLGDYHLMEGQNPVYIITIEPDRETREAGQ